MLHHGTDLKSKRYAMGHDVGSDTFGKYMAETAQTDVQAILRGLPQRNVHVASSTLYQVVEGRPVSLSIDRSWRVGQLPDLISAREAYTDMLDAVQSGFSTQAILLLHRYNHSSPSKLRVRALRLRQLDSLVQRFP